MLSFKGLLQCGSRIFWRVELGLKPVRYLLGSRRGWPGSGAQFQAEDTREGLVRGVTSGCIISSSRKAV